MLHGNSGRGLIKKVQKVKGSRGCNQKADDTDSYFHCVQFSHEFNFFFLPIWILVISQWAVMETNSRSYCHLRYQYRKD